MPPIKRWQILGAEWFQRFLDEAAVKLARIYGDPRTVFTFATMPIVIVAYSGGFGPTFRSSTGAVSDPASAAWFFSMRSMGDGKFADWIAENRSTFFVSSTHHTRPICNVSSRTSTTPTRPCLVARNCGTNTCGGWWRS